MSAPEDPGPPRPKGGIGYHRGGRATFSREERSADAPQSGGREPRTGAGAWAWIVLLAAVAAGAAWLILG